jgi:hypothetical protein
MEPIGWATQIEPIWHGAPHSGLRPDARSCRIECVTTYMHAYALPSNLTYNHAGRS